MNFMEVDQLDQSYNPQCPPWERPEVQAILSIFGGRVIKINNLDKVNGGTNTDEEIDR